MYCNPSASTKPTPVKWRHCFHGTLSALQYLVIPTLGKITKFFPACFWHWNITEPRIWASDWTTPQCLFMIWQHWRRFEFGGMLTIITKVTRPYNFATIIHSYVEWHMSWKWYMVGRLYRMRCSNRDKWGSCRWWNNNGCSSLTTLSNLFYPMCHHFPIRVALLSTTINFFKVREFFCR